jgi:hypothetical protein
MNENDWAGKYPLQAVAFDIVAMTSSWESGHAGEGILLPIVAILSLPVDLALDVLLSPLDLVLWPLGFDKNDPGTDPASSQPSDAS